MRVLSSYSYSYVKTQIYADKIDAELGVNRTDSLGPILYTVHTTLKPPMALKCSALLLSS